MIRKLGLAGCVLLAFVAALAAALLSLPLHAQQSPLASPSTLAESPSSPLIGLPPPLPLTLSQWRRVQKNPGLLRQWQSALPLVGSHPAPAPTPPAGSPWQLGPQPPGTPILSNPLLLTDGTVIAHVACTGIWWKLTPDNTGSYLTGTWSQIASLPPGYAPLWFASAVLPDGRVIVEGGEYNGGTCKGGPVFSKLGAIYDPLTDVWTSVAAPPGWLLIGDAASAILADGTFMLANCCGPNQALLDPTALTWAITGSGKFDEGGEEGFILLPGGGVLDVDAYGLTHTCGKNTEVYSPLTGAWTSAGNTPSQLADCANPGNSPSYEIGPQVLRPGGTVVAFGATLCSDVANTSCADGTLSVTTATAIFDTSNSTWAAGPNIPVVNGKNYTLADAPAALLPSGNILFAASPNYQAFVLPTHFFELNGTDNTIAAVTDPTDAASFASVNWNFLVLPTGQVMALQTLGSNVWIYTPSGGPNASWAPTISSVPSALTPNFTYALSGKQLNGLSQGAFYGDDVQAATNYPLVRITNTASGHVFYARTFNHSTMSVAPSTAGSTNFRVPAGIELGAKLACGRCQRHPVAGSDRQCRQRPHSCGQRAWQRHRHQFAAGHKLPRNLHCLVRHRYAGHIDGDPGQRHDIWWMGLDVDVNSPFSLRRYGKLRGADDQEPERVRGLPGDRCAGAPRPALHAGPSAARHI